MRISHISQLEDLVYDYSHNKSCRKEQNCAEYYPAGIRFGILESYNKSQNYDTDNIIYYRRTHDRLTDLTLQLAHLTKGLDRDADTGRCKYDTYKKCCVELGTSGFGKSVESHIQKRSAYQRYEHTRCGYEKSLKACPHQVLEIGLKSCGEHQKYYTYLRHLCDKITLFNKVKNTGTDNETCNYLSDNLGCLYLSGQKAKKLCKDNNDCEISQY